MSAKRFVWGWEQKDLNRESVRKKNRILVIIFLLCHKQVIWKVYIRGALLLTFYIVTKGKKEKKLNKTVFWLI